MSGLVDFAADGVNTRPGESPVQPAWRPSASTPPQSLHDHEYVQRVQHAANGAFATPPGRESGSPRPSRFDERNPAFDQRELQVHRLVDQCFRQPLDPCTNSVIRYGQEHGKRQVRPAVAAVELGGRRLDQVYATYQALDGHGQLRPHGVYEASGPVQSIDTRRNRRAVRIAQRKTRRFQPGAYLPRKALQQNRPAGFPMGRADRANRLPHLVGGPRHHARGTVGLECQTAWIQELRDADLAQRRRQFARPMRGMLRNVFH